MSEEIVNPTPEVSTEVAPQATDNNKVIENYETLLKQQQSQFEQLMKQQELTNKVNQQLMNQMNSMAKAQVTPPTNNEHWIDKVLREEFEFNSKVDPVANKLDFNKNSKQIALWWLKYQKDRGLSNEEIANRYYRMVSGIENELANNNE